MSVHMSPSPSFPAAQEAKVAPTAQQPAIAHGAGCVSFGSAGDRFTAAVQAAQEEELVTAEASSIAGFGSAEERFDLAARLSAFPGESSGWGGIRLKLAGIRAGLATGAVQSA